MAGELLKIGQDLLRSISPPKGDQGVVNKFTGDPYIAEAAVIVPSQFRDNPGNPQWFFGPNGVDYKFEFEDLASASKAYARCPPLAAIINRKAQAYINGRTSFVNTRGKDVTDKNPDARRIMALLARPNIFQSWREFEAQQKIYIDTYGFCIGLPLGNPVGFDASWAKSIWNIPSYMVSAEEARKIAWFKAEKISDILPTIKLKYKDLNIEIATDELCIFKDFVPGMGSQIFPDSRIRALAMPINNIISAYESRNELINYAGSQGILTPETDAQGPIPLKEGEKEQLQADFKRQYGIKKGQSRYIISPAAMKWQPMGKATKDLMLFEEITDDIMRICDGYGYPSPLLNSEKGPSVSNTDSYKKQVYEDAIIPESINIYEQWNRWFKLEPTNITMVKSYDHLPILQQDQKLAGQAELYFAQALLIQFQNNLITLNQWRLEQGFDDVAGDDLYYYQLVALGRASGGGAKPSNNGNQQQQGQGGNPADDEPAGA